MYSTILYLSTQAPSKLMGAVQMHVAQGSTVFLK